MATQSRRGGPDIWPGFVDALSALFIIVLFVSMVFMGAQFFLSDALSGRDRTISRLQVRISELSRLLGLEQQKASQQQKTIAQIAADLRASIAARRTSDAALGRARDALAQERAARAALEKQRLVIVGDLQTARLALAAAQKDKAATQKKLKDTDAARAAAQAAHDRARAAQARLAADRARIIGSLEDIRRTAELLRRKRALIEAELRKTKAALDKSKAALDKSKAARKGLADDRAIIIGQLKTVSFERDRLRRQNEKIEKQRSIVILKLKESEKALLKQTGLRNKSLAEIVVLNRQIAALRRQLAAIQAILKATEERIKVKDVAIKDLSTRLNKALASRVQELERYRSEFFGRLREVLGNREDIKIVGDRFVFQSEVLFGSGSARLSEQGEERLQDLAKTLKAIMAKIPSRVNWVLRVDGHTDKRPIRGRYQSNWELSAARAISVVKFLIDEGIPANRLVAAGFGEQHPIDRRENDEAYARNRRIEFKITQR